MGGFVFGLIWNPETLCTFAPLCARTLNECYLSSHKEGKETFSILALVFMPKTFHGIILGVDIFQTQCHAVNLVEQLYKTCSAIFE